MRYLCKNRGSCFDKLMTGMCSSDACSGEDNLQVTRVGVGQHCQLRLGGHLTLTNSTQQQHTNTSTSGRRGATRSAEAAWTPHAYKHHHLNQIAIQLLDIQSQTDRQTERTVISIIQFTSYHSNLVSSPSHHPLHIMIVDYS